MFATLLLATALTIQDYATMPTISSPMIAPDGKRIAYVLTRADMERSVYNSDVWLIGADGTNDIQLTHSTGTDNHPRWSPDGSKIAFLSDRDGGRNAIWVIPANGGESEKLTNEKGGIADFEWSPDGMTIAFAMRDAPPTEKEDFRVVGADGRPSNVYLLDLASRNVTRLTRSGEFSFTNLSWSPDGAIIAAERQPVGGIQDFQNADIALISRSGEVRMLVSWPGSDRNPTFSPDGKSIAFLSTRGVADWLREEQIHVVPVSGGPPRLVAPDYNRTPDQVRWLDSQTIWFDGPATPTAQIWRVGADGSGFHHFSRVDGAISGLDVRSGLAAFVMQSLTTPPELYVSTTTAFNPRQLTHHNDAFRDRQLGETRVIRWKNPKDGLEIEGLLTLPIGYTAGKRYPLLTIVHGGPASRFDETFIGYLGYLYPVHVFAEQGFAVLRPNPRGTGGYGERFRAANRNDWGGSDWVDINAGIDKLIAEGIADPDRLGLMGWSYGGFMAAWAEGHSDRLKAISIGAPVVDLLSFHGTTDIRAFIPSYFHGSTDLLREHSPLWHLKPTKARVLIQHGDADDRVPLSQGTMLYRALQEMGVDVTMVIYPRSPHVPREPKQRIDVMRRNLELFMTILGQSGAPSPSGEGGPKGRVRGRAPHPPLRGTFSQGRRQSLSL
ncbi:MAG TPA: S9 family peptidase, partial [Thermoanaerobaculia bacterium]|nr:S9 family peptidase [Thermoanaerobaculia bacterium]